MTIHGTAAAGILPALRGPTTGLVGGDVGSGNGPLATQPCRCVPAPLPLPMDEQPLRHAVPAVVTLNYGLTPVSSRRRGAEEQHHFEPTSFSSRGHGALDEEQPGAAGEAAGSHNHPIWSQNPFDPFDDDTAPSDRPCRGPQSSMDPATLASRRHLATGGSATPLATQYMI